MSAHAQWVHYSTSGGKFLIKNRFLRHQFPISRNNVSRPTLLFAYFGIFSIDHVTISSLKSDVIFEYLRTRTRFPIKVWSFRVQDTIFGDFCDHNVCACAMSTLILLPVANLNSATPISYKTRTIHL